VTSCPTCGYVYEDVAPGEVAGRLRAASTEAGRVLKGADETAGRTRPEPEVWSALQYGCHLRDVLLVQRDRVVLAVVEDEPGFARMHREERVALCGYDAEPPGTVAAELAMAGELCALTFERLGPGDWGRRFVYNWPEAAVHDLTWLGRHALHEAVHHLLDMRQVLERVTEK